MAGRLPWRQRPCRSSPPRPAGRGRPHGLSAVSSWDPNARASGPQSTAPNPAPRPGSRRCAGDRAGGHLRSRPPSSSVGAGARLRGCAALPDSSGVRKRSDRPCRWRRMPLQGFLYSGRCPQASARCTVSDRIGAERFAVADVAWSERDHFRTLSRVIASMRSPSKRGGIRCRG